MAGLETYIASLVVFCGLMFILRQLIVLDMRLDKLIERLNGFEHSPELVTDDLLVKIEDLVTDTIGNMETPNWLDHLGGAAASLIQMKAMQGMQGHPSILGIEGQNDDNLD